MMRWILDLGWLVFLLILFRHFWQLRRALVQAQSWLKARGQIRVCKWTEVGRTLWPEIEYSYQVFDQDLVGKHLFLDTAHNNPNSKYARQAAYQVALAYRDHKEVDVYYNPNQPDQSALDVRIPRKLNLIIGLISFFILAQSLIILFRIFKA